MVVTKKAEYSYILAPAGAKLFQEVHSYPSKKCTDGFPQGISLSGVTNLSTGKLLVPGDKAPLSSFEPGDFIHAVEAFPGQGSVFGRSAGSFCQVRSISQENKAFQDTSQKGNNLSYSKVRLPSGSQRLIQFDATATFGTVSTTNFPRGNGLQKAGRSR